MRAVKRRSTSTSRGSSRYGRASSIITGRKRWMRPSVSSLPISLRRSGWIEPMIATERFLTWRSSVESRCCV